MTSKDLCLCYVVVVAESNGPGMNVVFINKITLIENRHNLLLELLKSKRWFLLRLSTEGYR